MKTKSSSKSFFNRSVLIPLVTVAVTLTQSSALADPDSDAAGSESNANFQFDYMHSRAEWEMLKERSYPLKTPLDGPTRSRLQREAAAQLETLEREAPQPQPPTTWTNIGPSHITSTGCSYGAENSGRIVSLATDPANSQHWLIGAASGGIWQTTDGGTTWSPRADDQSSMNTDAIAFAPGNSSIVYASLPLTGLLKSTNGGSTWALVNTNPFAGRGARAFAISPSDPNVVVAAVETSFFPDPAYGIYRTTNGGLNWTQKLSQSASALVSVPGNFTKQYAAIGQPYGGIGSNGLFRSTNSGQTWKAVSGPWGTGTNVGMFSLAISPSQPAVLYVWVQVYDQPNNRWLGRIYKSTNDGSSWALLPFPDPADPTKFGRPVSVDPSNPDVLYAGEVDLWKYDGQGWTKLTACSEPAPPNRTHVDTWELRWLGTTLLVTNDGGIFRSLDRGGTWQSLNGDLPIAQFYWGSLHPTNSNFGLAGVQDNGTPIWPGNRIWWQLWGGDGMSNAISIVNPDTHWLVSSSSQGIVRTRDGAHIENVDVDLDIDHTCAPFFSRFVSCPSSDQVVIAGTTKLWRSTNNAFTDAQPHWIVNSPDLNDCPPGCCNGIRAIEFAPSDTTCSTYAIAGGPKILATTNGGANWFTLARRDPLPDAAVTDLAFDPQDARKLYATFSGIDHGHVYFCKDITAASPTWSDISPPINTSHNAIAIDPRQSSNLYVGTDLGVLTSTNAGGSWTAVPSSQIPSVPVWDIQVSRYTNLIPNQVVVFTYGRGAYSGTLSSFRIGENHAGIGNWVHAENAYSNASLRRSWWFGDLY